MGKHESSTNGKPFEDMTIDEVAQRMAEDTTALLTRHRRERNFDRAIMIVSHLITTGTIVIGPDDIYGDHFQAAVKDVLMLLEAYQLDSPNGEYVWLEFKGRR